MAGELSLAPSLPPSQCPVSRLELTMGPGTRKLLSSARGPVCGSPQLSSSSPQLNDHPEQTNFLNTEHLPSLGNTLSEDAVTLGIQNVSWQETHNKLWDCKYESCYRTLHPQNRVHFIQGLHVCICQISICMVIGSMVHLEECQK